MRIPEFKVEKADNIVQQIVLATVKASGLTLDQIVGHARDVESIAWRHAAMNVAHEKGCSNTGIGRVMNKDHTTVINAVRRHRDLQRIGKTDAERRSVAIYEALASMTAEPCLRREPSYARRTISEPMLPDPDSNERFAMAMVAAHPEMVLWIMRRQQPTAQVA